MKCHYEPWNAMYFRVPLSENADKIGISINSEIFLGSVKGLENQSPTE